MVNNTTQSSIPWRKRMLMCEQKEIHQGFDNKSIAEIVTERNLIEERLHERVSVEMVRRKIYNDSKELIRSKYFHEKQSALMFTR